MQLSSFFVCVGAYVSIYDRSRGRKDQSGLDQMIDSVAAEVSLPLQWRTPVMLLQDVLSLSRSIKYHSINFAAFKAF